MPHIRIEHSKEIADAIYIDNLARELHELLGEQESIEPNNVKTRSIQVDNVYLGKDIEQNFLHITVQLLPGRSDELKDEIAEALFNRTKEVSQAHTCRISVELSELAVYKKN